jgi:HPt (histidine-containing phosphotransfer) domain-containing protein
MSAETPIDATVWRELQDTAGEDFAVELAGTFLEESPALLAELKQALAHGQVEAFRRAAHSLKSNALTFGATVLADRARALELGPLSAADGAALVALQAAYDGAAVTLRALIHG